MTGTADWAELLQPVARRLLADRPCREHNGDLRYGARGSLVDASDRRRQARDLA